MRLIADCGSTSCKWINDLGLPGLSGPGLNPTVMKEDEFSRRVADNAALWNADLRGQVSQVDFFGAGCTLASAGERMKEALQALFPRAEIRVESDLTAACLAVYRGSPVAVGILGTGSAAAGFNGKSIYRATPSLGYVLADEGAGSAIGRAVLTAYLYGELPPDLHSKFENLFPGTSPDSVLETFYGPEASGGRLARYADLAAEEPQHPFVENLVKPLFSTFISRHLLPLKRAGYEEAGIVGSVGYGFRHLLRSQLNEAGFSEVRMIKNPLDALPEHIWGKFENSDFVK